jgi:hypothetical protein
MTRIKARKKYTCISAEARQIALEDAQSKLVVLLLNIVQFKL